MKTSMNVLAGALALGAVIGGARVATAGQKVVHEVKVDLTARTASGSMGDARRSLDPSQSITITIRGMQDFSSGTAAFTNPNGVTGSCWTTEPKIVAALQSVKSDSHVAVQWDAQGKCIVVDNYASSRWSVKEQ
jgi:hypothetical protein